MFKKILFTVVLFGLWSCSANPKFELTNIDEFDSEAIVSVISAEQFNRIALLQFNGNIPKDWKRLFTYNDWAKSKSDDTHKRSRLNKEIDTYINSNFFIKNANDKLKANNIKTGSLGTADYILVFHDITFDQFKEISTGSLILQILLSSYTLLALPISCDSYVFSLSYDIFSKDDLSNAITSDATTFSMKPCMSIVWGHFPYPRDGDKENIENVYRHLIDDALLNIQHEYVFE